MLLVLHKLQEAALKEIWSNTYQRSFSTHVSSRRDAVSICSKYGQETIWQIYSQKYSRHRHLKSWYIKLECATSEMLHDENKVYLIMGRVSPVGFSWAKFTSEMLHCTFFSFGQVFIPRGFSWEGFDDAVSHAHQMHMTMYSFFFLVQILSH